MLPLISPLFLFAGGITSNFLLLFSRKTIDREVFVLRVCVLAVFMLTLTESNFYLTSGDPQIAMAGVLGRLMPVGAFMFLKEIRRKETLRLLEKYNPVLPGDSGPGIVITDNKGKIVACSPLLDKAVISKADEFVAGIAEGKCRVLGGEDLRGGARVVLFNGTDAMVVWCQKYEEEHTAVGKFKIFFIDRLPDQNGVSGADLDSIKCCYYNFVPVILVALDTEGVVRVANKHLEALMGLTQQEITGRSWFEEFVPAEARWYCHSVFKQCLASGREQYFESVIFDGAGQKRHIRWKCGMMECAKGDSILFSGEDITRQRSQHFELVNTVDNINKLKEELEERVKERTEDLEIINRNLELHIEERDEIERQLVNSERLHMAMARNFPNGIIAVLDRHLRFVLVDGRELESLGYTSWGLKGKYISAEEFDMDASAIQSLKDAFKGKSTTFDFAVKGIFYRVTAVPLPDHQNQIDKILAVCQNVTEQKKLEQSLYSSLDQERRLNELKTRFVTMASHEFRTPLSTILSSVFLLESYDGAAYIEHKQEHIERIKRTVNILTDSLNDFLRVGKLEEGQIRLVLTETCVRAYLNEIVREMQTMIKPGQEILYQHQGIEMKVLLDRNVTRGILMNLLSNAVKYSPENCSIWLNTFLGEDELVIEVIDQGLGIPEEEQKHIFDRFFRAVNALHIEGTGLGLHIVKKYVEMMNGTIDFVSVSKGTSFTVKVPLKRTRDNTRLILC